MRIRGLMAIAAEGDAGSAAARVHHVQSLGAARVELGTLRVGRHFLERWPVCAIHPENDWRADHYVSNAPATFVLRDVIVHSRSGLIRIGDDVVAETVVFSDPAADAYSVHGDTVVLRPARISALPGLHLSTLHGISGNYYHALVDGVARVGMVPAGLLGAVRSVLYSGGVAQDFALARCVGVAGVARHAMQADEAFHVERLILPLSVHHNGAFHPCLSAFFDGVSSGVDGDDADLPRRFYVDRRRSAARRLLNESEVIERLRPLGFVAVRVEDLSVAQQVRLFRNAEAIVAPHGAALTNLGWCRAGCAVLELQMDAYAHWFFRNLAGLRGVAYDCVFGRSVDPWPEDSGRTQGLRWVVSAEHVVAGAALM